MSSLRARLMSLVIGLATLLAMVLVPAAGAQASAAVNTGAFRPAGLRRPLCAPPRPGMRGAPPWRSRPRLRTRVCRMCGGCARRQRWVRGLHVAAAHERARRTWACSRRTPSPPGMARRTCRVAYNLPSATAGSGETVAIVDAYDDPNAEADLATYRAQYGLPACTTANGCFEKVNQEGQQGNYPPPTRAAGQSRSRWTWTWCRRSARTATSSWSRPTATSTATCTRPRTRRWRWARSTCPTPGAACEYSGETSDDQYFNHPGVVITAAGGDSGYDNYLQGCTTPNYPAASQYVTSVGGTRLTRDSSVPRGWTETTWEPGSSATGSGCSQYEPKPCLAGRHRLREPDDQ